MTEGERRCPLCPRPVQLTADAEPFVVAPIYRSGVIVKTAQGRIRVAYVHASCWYAEAASS